MQIFVWCCISFSLFSISCLGRSRIQSRISSGTGNLNFLKCLDKLVDVTDWVVDDFLLISDNKDTVDGDFFKRHSNLVWSTYSIGMNNFTGFSNVILFTNNFYTLMKTFSEINIQRIDSRAKFVISVTKNFETQDEIKLASKGIPAVLWGFDKTQILCLVPSGEDILAMTYFPFARECQVGELEVLDTWRESDFVNGIELFPEKMLDINGCPQNHSAIFIWDVEFQLHEEFTETGDVILGGVGGRLITIVAERMNMTLQLLPQKLESFHRVMDQVLTGESLFSIAGNIPTADRVNIFDMDTVFMEDSYVLAYIAGSIEISWKNIVWPLSSQVWGYIGFIFLLFCSLIFLINRFYPWGTVRDLFKILDSFGIFLGTSRPLPRSYFGRYLILIWIIYSFLINAFYNCGLVSFLTTPNEQRVINTFEDLLADGMDFGAGPFVREFYHDPSDPIMMKIYNNFKLWPNRKIQLEILLSGQGAVGIFSSTVYQHNSVHVDDVSCRLRMLTDRAFTFHAPIFLRRGSLFAFGIHRYTLRVIESGLFEYWRRYYTRTPIPDNPPSTISIQHLRGILGLYLAGIVLSFVVFLSEIIFH